MTSAKLTSSLPTVGQSLGRYQVERVVNIPENSSTLILLRHQNGAKHAHVMRDDDNLGFGVTFPTVPQDSTGIAHILEHIVLMGSQKYPVPDPFFSMIPRSLNTFMNAMTGSDWTTYPFSTRNTRDYYNLLSVYLDATFFPLLRYESFRQDGHRFEFAQPDDPTSVLNMQGVVYNEMKGAMASVGAIMWRAFGKALYPDLTYANNSGGNPSDIPQLTYEDLKAFHAGHYHPSNAYFYSYGNQDLGEVLAAIEDQVMQHFSKQDLDVSIPDQPNFDAPKREEVRYPSSDIERGGQVLLAWKLGLSIDSDLNLRWSVLSDVLLGNAAAPLTKPLIDSGLGAALADLTGYRDSFRESAFGVGLKGLGDDKTEQVEELVLATLRQIVADGIDPDLIESSLHQFEIDQKEVSNAGYPYSLQVMFGLLDPWMYGGDPVTGLTIEPELKRLRDDLAAGKVFEEMIQRDLLDNPHRVTLTLIADPQEASRTEQAEREMIERLSKDFNDDDKALIIAESQRLAALQAEEPDVNVLPTLTLEDIPASVPQPEYSITNELPNNACKVARVPQPTGGLVYLDVQLRLPQLPSELLEILPLYAYALTRSGAAGRDYVAQARRLEAVTGGISASVGVGAGPDDNNSLRVAFTLSGKALSRNADALVEALRDVLAQPEFERERLRQLLEQRLSGMKASVVNMGHSYASHLANAQLGSYGALEEQLTGLTSLQTLKDILEGEGQQQRLDELLARFAKLTELLLTAEARLCLTSLPADQQLDLGAITGVLQSRPLPDYYQAQSLERQPRARLTDSPVSFNALAFATVPYSHPDSAPLLVLAQLLRSELLLKEIREKGGAYGAHAGLNPRSGVFVLSTYRDPHFSRSYQVFHEINERLAEILDDTVLLEAILSASRSLDPLTSPDTIGRMRFYNDEGGYTSDKQAEYKERLLAVSLADLRCVAEEYLRPECGAYASVTGKDPADEAAKLGLSFEVATI